MIRALAILLTGTLVLAGAAVCAVGADGEPGNAPAAAVKSPLSDAHFFPLAVWLQDQRNAAKYKAIGINVFVAAEPDDKTLGTLKNLGMYAICEAGDNAYKHKDDPTIIAWMHGDEPDNAQDIKVWKSEADIKKAWPESPNQTLAKWGEYGPPIPPSRIVAEYAEIKKADPTRPVLLNLGQGVAWEGYYGRGYRTGKLQDYAEYMKGCDIASFDIYPVNHDNKAVEGKLEFVAQGVDRLLKWGGQRSAWNCIECTPMGGPERNPTPSQVRSEVWMSLIHGSKGIIYFSHIFKPKFIEAGLLANPEMAKAVGAINQQITELAPVLNSPALRDAATVESSSSEVPIDILVKKADGAVYIFAVAMRNAAAKGAFQVQGLTGGATAEVLGEDRKVEVTGGKFSDDFAGYGVHLYKITASK